jgi:microcompartment protein CcmL/EutN
VDPALGLLEFESIAVGLLAGDAMIKRAPLAVLFVGTVHPGRFLALAGGDVASVEEALAAGRDAGRASLRDEVFLPAVHATVVEALVGRPRAGEVEALGIVETHTVAAAIGAADAGVKGAAVSLFALRLADGLGGKGYVLFAGPVAEVEAAVGIAVGRLRETALLVSQVVIPQVHPEVLGNLRASPRFRTRLRSRRAPAGE